MLILYGRTTMRNERQAYLALKSQETVAQKVERISKMDKPFAFRLAAIIACDTNKGKVW